MGRELHNVSSDDTRGHAPGMIDDTNYATVADVEARARQDIIDLLPRIRSQRVQIEAMWDRFYKVWSAKMDVRLYEGRSDLYFPIGRKVIETQVSHTKGQLFPAIDSFYIEPSPDDPLAMDAAPRIARLMRHDIEQARVGRYLDLFLRQMFIYGCTVVKFFWKTNSTTNYRMRLQPDAMGGQAPLPMEEKVLLYEGPTFGVIDLNRWYIHPITALDIDDAKIIVEEDDVDWNFMMSMQEADIYTGVERLKEVDNASATRSDNDVSRNLRLATYGISVDQVRGSKKTEWKLSEIWCKFDLYGDGRELPCKITVVDDVILEIRQNPFFHQRAPYRAAKYIDVPDNFYGQGLVESIEHQQYALNAIINQAIDSVIFQTNHMIAVNTAALDQDVKTLKIAPRAIWKVLGPPKDAIEIIRPPDNSQAAFATAQLISGSMQDSANSPPIMQGKMTSKEMTAEESGNLMAGAMMSTSGTIKNLESSVLSPMLLDWYLLEQQFRSLYGWVKIAGMPPLPMTPQDLVGDYTFRWLVGSEVPPMASATGQDQPQQPGMPGQPVPGQQSPPMEGSAPPALGNRGGS